jgi:Fic family protein
MKIPPSYSLTPKILDLIQKLEINKQIIDSVSIFPEIEKNIKREALLKSSLFSAKIEGNRLDFAQIKNQTIANSGQKEKMEIANILKALAWLNTKVGKERKITQQDILELHRITMKSLVFDDQLGRFRREPGAIFNQAGVAVYLSPPFLKIPELMGEFLDYINSPKEKNVPVKAALAHLSFEKIHPFSDGNGRVGRLLFQMILGKEGYQMKSLVTIEEYINEHKDDYYYFLDVSQKEATDYLEFILEGLRQQTEKVKDVIFQKEQNEPEEKLLPRRREILNIVKDHHLVSFDFLQRRFLAVNARTLRYDLKKLAQEGFIVKKGKTRGVFYAPKE